MSKHLVTFNMVTKDHEFCIIFSIFGNIFFKNNISSLNVCMVKKYILYFVATPRNFIIAKLSIRKPGCSSVILLALMKI